MLKQLDLPFDFLLHLQRKLGTERDVTVSLLGDWLESYEPSPRAIRIRDCPSPPAADDDLACAS
jgi:hypothetical protein